MFFPLSHCGKMKNLLSPKQNSSNQLFSNFLSKTVTFTKFLPKKKMMVNFGNFHTVRSVRNKKSFVKTQRNGAEHCVHWFHGNFQLLTHSLTHQCNVQMTENLSHFSFGKISWKQCFAKQVTKDWFHEIFFRWERISRFSTLWQCTPNLTCNESSFSF